MLGTGNTGYSELGFLMPGKVGDVGAQFQLYVNTQLSKWEAYKDIMAHFGVGLNAFIHKHNAKVTLEYRNRPIFDAAGNVRKPQGQLLRSADAPVHLGERVRRTDRRRQTRGGPRLGSPLVCELSRKTKNVLIDPLGCILKLSCLRSSVSDAPMD